jgi:hypothetical protein
LDLDLAVPLTRRKDGENATMLTYQPRDLTFAGVLIDDMAN